MIAFDLLKPDELPDGHEWLIIQRPSGRTHVLLSESASLEHRRSLWSCMAVSAAVGAQAILGLLAQL